MPLPLLLPPKSPPPAPPDDELVPVAVPQRNPAEAMAADKEKKRKERLTELKVEIHKRLLEDLNLSALESASEQQLRTEIASLATEALDEMSVALNKDDRLALTQELYDEVMGLGQRAARKPREGDRRDARELEQIRLQLRHQPCDALSEGRPARASGRGGGACLRRRAHAVHLARRTRARGRPR